MTMIYNTGLAKVNAYTKNEGHRSNGSAVGVLTDTHRLRKPGKANFGVISPVIAGQIAPTIAPVISIAGQIAPAIAPAIFIAGRIAPAITDEITPKFAFPGFRT